MIIRVVIATISGFIVLLNLRFLFFIRFDVTREVFTDIILYRSVVFQMVATLLLLILIYFLTVGYAGLKHPVLVIGGIVILITFFIVMHATLV